MSPQRHAWSQATGNEKSFGSSTDIVERLDLWKDNSEDRTAVCSNDPLGHDETFVAKFVTPSEAHEIINSLVAFTVEQIGDGAFFESYAFQLQRLSLQAHASAQGGGGEEYIVESIIEHGKIPTLVRTLLSVEAWRTFVLIERAHGENGPSLLSKLARNGNSLRCAFILHVETTLVGLLNLTLYRRDVFHDGLDGETAIALVDYCSRCMASLATPLHRNDMVRHMKEWRPASESMKKIIDVSAEEEINETRLKTEYRTCVGAVSTARYLCEHIEDLPLEAQTRILDTHDFIVMMVPLIEEPPWTRLQSAGGDINGDERGGAGAGAEKNWEKLIDNRWEHVPRTDLLRITKCEAQCWLSIYHLTCSNVCRQRYAFNSFRKCQLLRLRKFLNEVMLDQLPILAEVMRYMDELSLMAVPETATGEGSALLMQQVALVRDDILRGRDWSNISERQYNEIFSKVTDGADQDLRRIADLYSLDGIECVVGEMDSTFAPMSNDGLYTRQPVASLSLRFMQRNILCEERIFSPAGEGTLMKTEYGIFRRFEMTNSAEGRRSRSLLLRDPHASAIAVVSFGNSFPPFTKAITCDDLNIPIDGGKKGLTRKSTLRKQWRQIGNMKEKLVLQLGFDPHVDESVRNRVVGFELRQVFLSRPSE